MDKRKKFSAAMREFSAEGSADSERENKNFLDFVTLPFQEGFDLSDMELFMELASIDISSLHEPEAMDTGVELFALAWGRTNEFAKARSEKYIRMNESLKEQALLSWFSTGLLEQKAYEQLAFSANDLSADDPQRASVIEQAFFEYYKENISELGVRVVALAVDRAFALQPAINAHIRGEYALSIPVFLSQAEGVLRAVTSAELFTSSKESISKFASGKQLKVDSDTHWSDLADNAVWVQLSEQLPLAWGERKREEKNYEDFNRNTTLHGIDLNYASERNSLKAFSLLCHVVELSSKFGSK